MSINPDNITTIRVDQLAESTLNLTNDFPHSEGATLKKAKIQSLVDLVATAVGSGSGVGFLPISVTDGQQLPNVPTDPSFFLCGVGTFLNINGYPNIVCTEELNAIMSVSDHWEIAVEIPINVDLQSIGISQSVNNGVLDKAPSENAVYDFIAQWLPKASLGYFDYADLATQTTPISVTANVQTLLTNDTLGDDTNTSQPPYGVTAIWDADSDEFNFSQLSVGDTVDIRVHLKTTTTSANQKYHIDMKFAFDGPDEFENRIFSQYVKNASEDEQSFVTTLYIGSESVRTYPARLYITSDDDATVEVVGWFCRVFRKSVNIVDLEDPANLISTDPDNAIELGTDGKLWSGGGGGGSTPDATESVKGKAQLATEAETIAGINDSKIVTPAKLAAAFTDRDLGYAPENVDNKTNTIVGNETSTSLYASIKGIVDYYTTSRIKTLLGQASSTVDGWLSSTDWNTFNNKQNVLTDIVLGALINSYGSKTTPVGDDGFLISNSADSNKAYKVSYTNLSATLKSYFDTLYANPTLIVKRILNNTVETTPLTGTTSETLIYSAPVIAAGTFTTNDYFNFQLTFRKNGISETACTYRVKVSNTNNYSTATLIASWQSQRYNTILQRLNLYFKSDGTLNSPVQTSTNTQTDLTNSSVSLTSISLDPTQDIYFFVSAQLTTSTESVTMNAIKIFN